jgi:hypothetical protein
MAEIQPINIAGNMLAGVQGAQQIAANRDTNQLRQLQMQQAQQQIQQGQQQTQRDQDFRNQLGTYLQGGTNALASMYATDPERAMQVQTFQTQQNQLARQRDVEAAKRSYAEAQGILMSEAPATYFRVLMPDKAEMFAKQRGMSVDKITDEEATQIANQVATLAGAQAGLTPEYTEPKEGQKDGRDVFFRTEKRTGRTDVLPGVSPRPQRPLVSVNTSEEKAEAKKVGEGMGTIYIDLQKAGAAAPTKLGKLDRMEQLMEGVNTGKLAPAMTQVASIADSFGFKVDPKLGPKQALEGLSNEIALDLRNPAGGAGMPGAMSDKDREFLMSMPPGLSKTREGNKLIIQTARAVAQREQDVARLAREYRKKNGSLDEGFYDDLADFSAANPLFGKRGTPVTTPDGWIITEKK